MKKSAVINCVVLIFFLVLNAGTAYSFISAERISKDDLRARLDDPDTIIIDTRLEQTWQKSETKIRGAVHEDPLDEESSWAHKYPKDKVIVLYCD